MNLTELNRSCEHFSCPERSVSPAVYILLYVCSAAVVLLTVCGNLLVIISVCYFKQLHTPTNMLVLSLAASDLLVGLFVMPFHFTWLIESCWMFGHVFCILYNFMSFQLTSVSVGNVVLIALDRYIALSNPFLYLMDVTSTIVRTLICLAWVFSFIYNFVFFYINGNFTGFSPCPGECLVEAFDDLGSLIDLMFIIVIPTGLMLILYFQVFVIARRHANAIRELTRNFKNVSDEMKSERKAAKVLGIVVFVFLACLVPYYVCTLMGKVTSSYIVNNILILFFLNSSINPIIYALFYTWFQKCTKMILTCKILHTDCSFVNVL
ncbi:trace amine-associated receptor 7d-like [Silurus meridionalis]|uniref:trace amine-associated receptor 7d-like n=1 Tax=Silurus meridionalis TaxID=175797 RepID=UPI001EEB7EAF|nr:trace amine-associated receptor 7d-like [Silurus meridionalis]